MFARSPTYSDRAKRVSVGGVFIGLSSSSSSSTSTCCASAVGQFDLTAKRCGQARRWRPRPDVSCGVRPFVGPTADPRPRALRPGWRVAVHACECERVSGAGVRAYCVLRVLSKRLGRSSEADSAASVHRSLGCLRHLFLAFRP